jgi:phosphatidylcholine synthase
MAAVGDLDPERPPPTFTPQQRAAAFCVHIFTACGVGLGLLALIAATRGEWTAMFLWLGLALLFDGVDGPIARKLRVPQVLPNWSGDALDFVVDFVTYVFVPAYAIAASGLLPPYTGVPLAFAIVVSGALYFGDLRMKTADNFFRGFPVLWNAVAFYLLLLKPSPWLGALSIVALVGLTFVPIKFLHPVRVRRMREVNLALLVLWAALAGFALARDLDPGAWVTTGLCAIAVYFLGAGLLRREPDESP